MAHFGKALERLRKARHLSRAAFGQLVGVTERQIYTWETSAAPSLQGKNYLALATALGLTTDQFDREWRANKIDQSVGDPIGRGIPLINKAPAGTVVDYSECSMADSGQGAWYVPRDGIEDPNAFAVVITGDSMEPLLLGGGIAYFSPMDTDGKTHFRRVDVPDGHVMFIRFSAESKHDGCTVARCWRKGGGLEITKENKKYKPFQVDFAEVARMAALVRFDLLAGMTKVYHPEESQVSSDEEHRIAEGVAVAKKLHDEPDPSEQPPTAPAPSSQGRGQKRSSAKSRRGAKR